MTGSQYAKSCHVSDLHLYISDTVIGQSGKHYDVVIKSTNSHVVCQSLDLYSLPLENVYKCHLMLMQLFS